MKPTEALQKTLYAEMLGRIKETDLSVPVPRSRLLLLLADGAGQAVPDLLPQEELLDAPEEVILDVNELARGREVHVRRRRGA